VRIAEQERWAAAEDAARLRDALGCSLPVGLAAAFLGETVDPLGDLVARYARSHAPFTVAEVAAWLGLGPAVVRDCLARLVSAGRVAQGELRPPGWAPTGPLGEVAHAGAEFCDAQVLRLLRRRSLAALRAEVEPVPAVAFARFIPQWQRLGRLRGAEGLLAAVRGLAGYPLPASALESMVLPARVPDYTPALLDGLIASGEVIWQGHGALSGTDGWVSLHATDTVAFTLRPPAEPAPGVASELQRAMSSGAAFFFRGLAVLLGSTDDAALTAALWELVWSGQVTNDTFAPVRALLAGGRTAHRSRPATPRGRYAGRFGVGRLAMPTRAGPPEVSGRWSRLPARETDPTVLAAAQVELLIERYGFITRGSVVAEDIPGGFAGVYRVCSVLEDAGDLRRGYFVEGLGAAQFGERGAVDELRRLAGASGPGAVSEREAAGSAVVLAACDPANPYGAALPWPARPPKEDGGAGHQPGRKAGALVVLLAGELVLYVERGGRTLLCWSEDPSVLGEASVALAGAVRRGALGKLSVEKIDGTGVFSSEHPLATALAGAGFRLTPRGLRLSG
jgi:ATP-dependent Lhr-like helicase